MSLHIDKPDTMQNEKVQIRASGLRAEATYLFVMRLRHNYGTHKAFASFRADSTGKIDLKYAKPLRGTYQNADPMGLFLSMAPCEDFAYGGYLRCTPPIPFIYELQIIDAANQVLDTIYIKKHWMHPKLTRTEIEHDGFFGTLFKPPGHGPFPAIIDLSGTGGGIHEHKGAMLASEGFVVLCVAFFQYKDLPAKMEHVDLNYFKKPIDFLLSLPFTHKKLGIQGVSFGATVVDLLATRHGEIKSVVSINGPHGISDYVFMKENGVDLPMHKFEQPTPESLKFINKVLITAPTFKEITLSLTAETEIPWWKAPSDVKFRIIGSVDDMCQPSVHCTIYRQRRLKETGHDVEVELVNGGHIMEPPYFPHYELVYAKFQGFYCGYGGEVVLHAKAQERTWANTIKFFKRTLGCPPDMPDWDRFTQIERPANYENHSKL
ncbi:unnamed protein product [Caenorhabditis bovis]|uniref:BAAT/Acyl-CoA thioester hydrolase C-terminal domain-containing protein n=1 Tax=Caenorhabditis bovis TaxID=2654633 RepID=A0A8S1F5J3_9PELO|nr:unnamed protein product [Caenorhabditis bovis]